MSFHFDWDPEKSAVNAAKHGISFAQALSAFDDPNAVFIDDPEHSGNERREKLLGMADDTGVILVIFTERAGETIRIISAREATRRERRQYVQS